ncbi:FG-GAP-like repeat-containing protein [Psychroserpens algicola]|uniref:FG-GAP-like repeat-containing protein n=1 Tax=Psychroserpens algicola TaxID=1719034 RepID=A0ABT0H9U5_9FLAO|nr:FG-GAP-like repeat-containing protein [Psychroserpens algicola]MCK8481121.1 FG-GAP-like repeat-containing protein [Psychroserpens algicola]
MKQQCQYCILLIICAANFLNAQTLFENQATNLGLNTSTGDTFLGNGLSFFDFDNDGWDDITLTSSENNPLRFFKNNNGSFVEQDFGLSSIDYQTKSVTWVDFDNDGDNDLFVTSDAQGNKMFENLGNMVFQDISVNTGMITTNMFTYGASWGDINNDGFLDVFLSNRTSDITNKLYKNNGDGTFTDITSQSGIDQNPVFSFCSAFVDINNDGYQDLYVSNDKLSYENKLYRNNGDGTFTDISASSGTNISVDAMSVTVGDYNRDGYFDIYVTNNPTGNYLFRNNGDETFQDVAMATGTSFNSIGWGASFFEADNDMDVDLYVSGQLDGSSSGLLSAAFYENNNNTNYVLNNNCFPNDNGASYSNAIGDIDNDGLLDIVVSNNANENVFLWRNVSSNSNNWIKLKLIGVQSNANAIGARIEISTDGYKQYAYTICGEGYLAQMTDRTHFGLGNHSIIDYIKIYWPNGLEETYTDVQVNQTLILTEGDTLSVNTYEENNITFNNPVAQNLYIETTKFIQDISLYTIQGQLLSKVTTQNKFQTIDMANFKSGIYLLNITFENQSSTFKVVKK